MALLALGEGPTVYLAVLILFCGVGLVVASLVTGIWVVFSFWLFRFSIGKLATVTSLLLGSISSPLYMYLYGDSHGVWLWPAAVGSGIVAVATLAAFAVTRADPLFMSERGNRRRILLRTLFILITIVAGVLATLTPGMRSP